MPTLNVSEVFVLQNRNAGEIDVFAYLLAELVALDVVRIQTVLQRPHPLDTATVRYDYLEPGINFDRYYPTPAQDLILREVRQTSSLPLHILAKKLRESGSPKGLIGNRLDSAHMALQALRLIRTRMGYRYHRAVKRELKEVSRNFRKWLIADPERLKESASRLGLLLLLAPGLTFSHLALLAPLFETETWAQSRPGLSGPVYYDWGTITFSAPWEAFKRLDGQVYKFEQAFNRVKDNRDRRLDFYFGAGEYR